MAFRNFFKSFIHRYNQCLASWPITTNAFTGFTIAAAGDIVCQHYEQKYDKSRQVIIQDNVDIASKNVVVEYDWIRVLQMGVIRAAVIVPFITFWFPFLARVCPGPSITRVLGRVAIDQAFGSPIVIVLVFFSNACFQGDPLSSIDRIYTQGGFAWGAGLQYWPIVHTFNFGLVPLHHQALVAHIASLYWNAILSYYSNRQTQPKATIVDDESSKITVDHKS